MSSGLRGSGFLRTYLDGDESLHVGPVELVEVRDSHTDQLIQNREGLLVAVVHALLVALDLI